MNSFACFRDYSLSLDTRQRQQPTRNHPENLNRKEFLCPLCKSLGNCLLPVLWDYKHETVNWGSGSEMYEAGEFTNFSSWITERALPSFATLDDRESKGLSAPHFSSKLSGLVTQLTNAANPDIPMPGQFPESNTNDPNLMSYCSRLVTVVKIVYKHINPEYRESFVGLNYLDLLWYISWFVTLGKCTTTLSAAWK
jgi:hypothetical protein